MLMNPKKLHRLYHKEGLSVLEARRTLALLEDTAPAALVMTPPATYQSQPGRLSV
ncbi:hypothetical protein QCN27_15160 [Cereibacter sp. SYSU M97828]|nr:hypothetical protein [Cereibacter flavus]